MLSITETVAHIDRAACSEASEYTLLSLFCRLRQENGTDRSRVLFFLVTDGLDNSSIGVERSEFEKRMESLYAKGWEILVGGKDIDSEFREASDMFLEMRKA